MKRLIRFTIALSVVMVSLSNHAMAQDIHFSQFYENAILRNPALTGIFSGDYKAGVNYRTQWGNISNPFQTVIASVESRVAVSDDIDDYFSFGLTASYDHAGSIDFNSLQIFPAINYNKSLSDERQSYLSAGFAGGFIQRSFDPSKVTVDNQWIAGGYDASAATRENMTSVKIMHWDISAGLSFNSSIGENNNINYYLGAAAWHVSRPKEAFNENETFSRLSTKYVGSLGFMWHIDNNFGLTFHANYMNQAPYQETMLGGFLSWRNTVSNTQPQAFGIYAGLFYRVKDAIIPTIKVDWKTYSFTSSYDVTTSSLKPSISSKGGWEFSIYARGKIKRGSDAKDHVKCPRFEEMSVTDGLRN